LRTTPSFDEFVDTALLWRRGIDNNLPVHCTPPMVRRKVLIAKGAFVFLQVYEHSSPFGQVTPLFDLLSLKGGILPKDGAAIGKKRRFQPCPLQIAPSRQACAYFNPIS
jgi:hypothetical protein